MESIMFCPNCNNTFDITKTVQQTGSGVNIKSGGAVDYAKLIDQILNQTEDLDFKNINKEELIKSKEYLALDEGKREFVSNKLLDLELNPHYDSNKNAAYFNCNNCGNIKKIKPGTLIYTKTSNDVSQSYISSNMMYMNHSTILPHTKNYTCANKSCETHKNPKIKDAKMFKPNNSYAVKYICTVCNTFF
jgi:hypothetical protein